MPVCGKKTRGWTRKRIFEHGLRKVLEPQRRQAGAGVVMSPRPERFTVLPSKEGRHQIA
jgi:hypothetical protein